MNRHQAANRHQLTNMAYWLENPNWNPEPLPLKLACKTARAIPFDIHGSLKRLFFDPGVIAVNGESVVADGKKPGTVDKFMFRYPREMAINQFESGVRTDVGVVCGHLPTIALQTTVSIREARVFRNPNDVVEAVTQTQEKLDLVRHQDAHKVLLADSEGVSISGIKLATMRDLESMLKGIESMGEEGYFPDIAPSSGNLRIDNTTGSITLIDVMPAYSDGTRLIGEAPDNWIPHIQDSIAGYSELVGKAGGSVQ